MNILKGDKHPVLLLIGYGLAVQEEKAKEQLFLIRNYFDCPILSFLCVILYRHDAINRYSNTGKLIKSRSVVMYLSSFFLVTVSHVPAHLTMSPHNVHLAQSLHF